MSNTLDDKLTCFAVQAKTDENQPEFPQSNY